MIFWAILGPFLMCGQFLGQIFGRYLNPIELPPRDMDLSELREGYTRLQETPFSGETKTMSVKCESARSSGGGAVTYFVKGAPERISASCREDSGFCIVVANCNTHLAKLGWE